MIRALKNQTKIYPKWLPTSHRKLKVKKLLQKWILGGSWEGFGRVWGLFGPLLGDFGSFFGRSKSIFLQTWAQDGLQEALWIDFGWILKGFGKVLEGLGPGFRRVFANCSTLPPLTFLALTVRPFLQFFFVSGTPALLRQLAWRHNYQIE